MSDEVLSKIYLILEKIEYIETIVENMGGVSQALDDVMTARAAILMHLTAIAEQFNRLKQKNPNLLEEFVQEDLKGLYDVRTYIAHDYEGVNLAIIEWIIRYGLDRVKQQCSQVLEKYE